MKSRFNKYNIICTTLGATLGTATGMTICAGGLVAFIKSDMEQADLLTQYAWIGSAVAPIPIMGFFGGRLGRKVGNKLANRNATKPPFWNPERRKILNKIVLGTGHVAATFMLGSILYVKTSEYLEKKVEERIKTQGLKKINSTTFNKLMLHEFKKYKADPNFKINWFNKFQQLHYDTNLENIDCRALPYEVKEWLRKTIFHKFNFTSCYLPSAPYRKCTFTNCNFDSRLSSLKNCLVIAENHEASMALQNIHSELSRRSNVILDKMSEKPIILIVYVKAHGTSCTDRMIARLQERGHQVYRIGSFSLYKEGQDYIPDHPLIKIMDKIDGIVLPGGHDLIQDQTKYSHREKLELFFYKQSLEHEIPLYAACRGHQFVGSMLGGEVINLNKFEHKQRITVTPDEDNFLYHLADKKYASQTRKDLTKHIKKDEESFTYSGNCHHHQHVLFKTDLKSQQAMITAIAEDGTIEGLQVRNHIITFQHHHETYGHWHNTLSKAVVKHYSQMVFDFHGRKNQIDNTIKHKM